MKSLTLSVHRFRPLKGMGPIRQQHWRWAEVQLRAAGFSFVPPINPDDPNECPRLSKHWEIVESPDGCQQTFRQWED